MQICGTRYGRTKEQRKNVKENEKRQTRCGDETKKKLEKYENWRYDTRRDKTARTERGTEGMIQGSNGLQTKRSEKRKGEMRQKEEKRRGEERREEKR